MNLMRGMLSAVAVAPLLCATAAAQGRLAADGRDSEWSRNVFVYNRVRQTATLREITYY